MLAFGVNHQLIFLKKRFNHGHDCIQVTTSVAPQVNNYLAQARLLKPHHRLLKFICSVLRESNDFDVAPIRVNGKVGHDTMNGNSIPFQQDVLQLFSAGHTHPHFGVPRSLQQFHHLAVVQLRARNADGVHFQNTITCADPRFCSWTAWNGRNHHQRILLNDEFHTDSFEVSLHGFSHVRQFLSRQKQRMRIEFIQYRL